MLEDVSNILSNGEVPNLFDKIKIKIPEILEKMKYNEVKRGDVILLMNKKLQEAGIRNADSNMAWNKFVLSIKTHLHFILVQSPSGDSLKNRLRSYPNLINCATINWFHPWPADALFETSKSLLKDMELEDDVRKKITGICVEFHESVKILSTRYREEDKR